MSTRKEEDLTESQSQNEAGTESNTQEANASATEKEFGEAPDESPIQLLEKALEEEKNKYLRLYAEFENFRRRSAKERIDLIGSAGSELMKDILPVVDDFERAIHSNASVDDIDAVKKGFELLHHKLFNILTQKGLKPMDSAGQKFDPEVHEAIAQVPATADDQKGMIIDVIEKGYELNSKILRHPKVIVGN